MGSGFGEVLKGVEKHGNVLMVIFRFMAVCDGDFDKVGVLFVSNFSEGRGGYFGVICFMKVFIV